jgi:hypothetical protein
MADKGMYVCIALTPQQKKGRKISIHIMFFLYQKTFIGNSSVFNIMWETMNPNLGTTALELLVCD